ncbi:hypothetical protein Acr_00g0035240 [Actinidia rufa]|uniref:DUF632 domain-containing protein n=1 Tax=Actinidia rufa TaxID=165716 RepID=A0A7J0DG73_9ERIC|nr:hypothetical protein Acr_00g0035240 [Actinidia rufa]
MQKTQQNSSKLSHGGPHHLDLHPVKVLWHLVRKALPHGQSLTMISLMIVEEWTPGSHSLTLGRLYAWEKKLYEEVKTGDSTWKAYERKILVAIRSAESISKRIEKLIDEELQPQIAELLQGLVRTWKVMLESHEIQNKIMFELEAELQNWRAQFIEFIAAQKSYIEALHGWLSKFVIPEVEFYLKGRSSAPLIRSNGPPLLVICHDWALWVQQGAEQERKRKVDSSEKELDRKILAFQKADNSYFESKLSDRNSEPNMEHQAESLREKKDLTGRL